MAAGRGKMKVEHMVARARVRIKTNEECLEIVFN